MSMTDFKVGDTVTVRHHAGAEITGVVSHKYDAPPGFKSNFVVGGVYLPGVSVEILSVRTTYKEGDIAVHKDISGHAAVGIFNDGKFYRSAREPYGPYFNEDTNGTITVIGNIND